MHFGRVIGHERAEQPGLLRDLAQRRLAQGRAGRRDERREMARGEVETTGQSLTLLALEFNQAMRNVVLPEEIMQAMTFLGIAHGDDAETIKILVPHETAAAHDEGVNDRLGHPGQFGQRASNSTGRHLQDFRLLRFYPRAGQGRGALEHGDIADKVALAWCAENLLGLFASFEDLGLTLKDDDERKIALPGAEDELAAMKGAPFA